MLLVCLTHLNCITIFYKSIINIFIFDLKISRWEVITSYPLGTLSACRKWCITVVLNSQTDKKMYDYDNAIHSGLTCTVHCWVLNHIALIYNFIGLLPCLYIFKVLLHSEIYFACYYFSWMFDLHCAEIFMCRLWHLKDVLGGKFLWAHFKSEFIGSNHTFILYYLYLK